jgi:hypothetical protein
VNYPGVFDRSQHMLITQQPRECNAAFAGQR